MDIELSFTTKEVVDALADYIKARKGQ